MPDVIPPYEVHAYSSGKFLELLASKAEIPSSRVAQKMHFDYLNAYLSDINVKTIIVENHYIDKDYLQDFAEYYLACFKKYEKTCTRLHFFAETFTCDGFKNALRRGSRRFEGRLQNSYLGFIVLKPLPETIIGRTCLRVYSSDGGRRHYLGIKKNPVCLFGFNLFVNSLPFQEQDTVVAACATSALWSVFHETGELFHHPIPSPSAITKQAFQNAPIDTRSIPNGEHGLNPLGMAAAIRSVGLEPLKLAADNEFIFRASIYAFLRCNIPVVLGVSLVDYCDPSNPVVRGRHAVAVTGYSIPGASSLVASGFGMAIKSLCIDKIYVHDDQIGPFSRMELDSQQAIYQGERYFSLTTTWRSQDGSSGKVKAFPEILVVPLYHKIRIPFMKVFVLMNRLGTFLEQIRSNSGVYASQFEWDLYLTTVKELKTNCLVGRKLKGDALESILLSPLPKYLWKMSVSSNAAKLVEFIFDATDIEQGNYLSCKIAYDKTFEQFMRLVASNISFPDELTMIAEIYSS